MPKKKLTKTQVKNKVKTAYRAIFDLYLDKLSYQSASEIPISKRKLDEMIGSLGSAGLKLGVKY
jgi:hypothetical protein